MPFVREFADAMQEIVFERRGLGQREVAERTGISIGYINQMVVAGRIPRRERLLQLADGLKLRPRERERLFGAAGYVDDAREAAAGELPEPVLEVAELMRPLKPHQLLAVKNLLASFSESERRGAETLVALRSSA